MASKQDGPFTFEHPALSEAIRAASLPKRKPTDTDGVPATKLPTTRAQREALWLTRNDGVVNPPPRSPPRGS